MKDLNIKKLYFIIIIATALILIPMLGNVHLFDWDEINFAECAREMIMTDDYLRVKIDYEPFWEKPPLFIWFQVISMKIFGINEFAARFPNAMIGIVTMIIIFTIGRKLFDEKFGLLWVLIYLGSFLPHFYFKTGIIDPTFNLFMFLSVYFIFKHYNETTKSKLNIILAGAFCGLAILTKGPVGLLLPFLTWLFYWLIKRKELKLLFSDILIFFLASIVFSLTWFGIEIAKNGFWFINEFTKYQIRLLTTGDAGHSGPFYYHFVVLMIGCFPASIFVFNSLKTQNNFNSNQNAFRLIMVILLLVVLVIFSIVKTKIIHYSSLCYYPITFLATSTIYQIIYSKNTLYFYQKFGIIFFGSLFSIVLTGIPILLKFKDKIIPYIKHPFVKGNFSAEVNWTGFEGIIGLFLLFSIIYVLILFSRQKFLKSFIILFSSVIIVIFLYLPFVVQKIEYHIQGAPIEFYQSLQNKDVYLSVLGFKSYAHLFYSNKPFDKSASYKKIEYNKWLDWLLTGDIDKQVFFVTKIHKKDEWLSIKDIKFLYEKNGWVFLTRYP